MPLINFKTNLTSLKYGLDKPGGGDSGQPYMQFPIPGPDTPPEVKQLYTLNQTSLDFPIRGGAITSLVNGSYVTTQGLFDKERISAFLKSAPRGTAFIQKQVGLQLSNPRLQVQNLINLTSLSFNNIQNIGQATGIVYPVTNAYNPDNTLAQVGVMGTGAHFNRQGVVPTLFESPRSTYQYIVGTNNTETTNRLTILKATKLLPNTNFQVGANNINNVGIDPDLVDRLGISTIQNQLFNYQGGPGSVYGIGSTIIRRATNTNGTILSTDAASIPPAEVNGFYVNGVTQAYSTTAFTYLQIAQQTTRGENGNALSPMNAKIQDFRAQTNNGNPIIPSENYTIYNIAKNYNGKGGLGIGNPGAASTFLAKDYRITKANAVDRLNIVNPFYYNATGTGHDPWTIGGSDTKDIIKFAFECIDNNNPDFSVALIFRAFFDGQISDSNQAEFNSFKYLGRGETFRTYQGFDRTIGFSFKVFAQTRQEMAPLYTKLNNLISQIYPDYSPTYNLMRGNVVRLTIGDYLYRVPGFLESVNVTIDNSNTPWEIVLGGRSDNIIGQVAQLPMMVTVQCTFKPIMDILPRKVRWQDPNVQLIANLGADTNALYVGGIQDRTVAPGIPATFNASTLPKELSAYTNLTPQQFQERNDIADDEQDSFRIPPEEPVVAQTLNIQIVDLSK
jgi:hypothetical protein